MPSKYRAVKTTIDGVVFDSKKEAARYVELKLCEKYGYISNLELQPKYILINKFTNSALTNEQAKEIRERVQAGEWRRGDGVKYAKKFGVGNSAISAVKNNLTWSHV